MKKNEYFCAKRFFPAFADFFRFFPGADLIPITLLTTLESITLLCSWSDFINLSFLCARPNAPASRMILTFCMKRILQQILYLKTYLCSLTNLVGHHFSLKGLPLQQSFFRDSSLSFEVSSTTFVYSASFPTKENIKKEL